MDMTDLARQEREREKEILHKEISLLSKYCERLPAGEAQDEAAAMILEKLKRIQELEENKVSTEAKVSSSSTGKYVFAAVVFASYWVFDSVFLLVAGGTIGVATYLVDASERKNDRVAARGPKPD